MNELPHLASIFDRLRRGYHLGPDDEQFSALSERYDDYARYFEALGLKLIRHPREFFYFEPDNPETVPDTLPRIAVFSYIIVDHAANQGRPIEEFVFDQVFLITALPHLSMDRYAALLRDVEVFDMGHINTLLNQMERIGWIRRIGEDEFRFLRPFHRVLSKCLEITQSAQTAQVAADTPVET